MYISAPNGRDSAEPRAAADSISLPQWPLEIYKRAHLERVKIEFSRVFIMLKMSKGNNATRISPTMKGLQI